MVLISKPLAVQNVSPDHKTYRYFDPRSCTTTIMHSGYPALMEIKPLLVARIPVTGTQLHQCVLTHPRYARGLKSSDYDIISINGFRRGRSPDVLLDVPLEYNGRKYGILNFKGAGADADYEMVIKPGMWYDSIRDWVPVDEGDPCFSRSWGALLRSAARAELHDDILPYFGIPMAPHVAANLFPDALNKFIRKEANETRKRSRFGQLVRVFDTNIRMSDEDVDPFGCMDSESRLRLVKTLGEINITVLKVQARLAKEGQMLIIVGDVDDNRMLDGQFTDADNYNVLEFYRSDANDFVHEVLQSPLKLLKSCSLSSVREEILKIYLDSMHFLTGVDFSDELGDDFDRNGVRSAVSNLLAGVLTEPI